MLAVWQPLHHQGASELTCRDSLSREAVRLRRAALLSRVYEASKTQAPQGKGPC